MKTLLVIMVAVAVIVAVLAEEKKKEVNERKKRAAYGGGGGGGGYGGGGYGGGYVEVGHYQHHEHHYVKKTTKCYQCAYSPPKTVYDKKVIYQEHHYGHQQHGNAYGGYGNKAGYGNGGYGNQGGYGNKGGYGNQAGYGNQGSYGNHNSHYGQGHHAGYLKKTVIPVPRHVPGGWDKCMGPFDHYQAKAYGVDVWDCHDNCYVRTDPNGNIFRGCYHGEYHVDPNKLGCSYQAGSLYCFCKGDLCNNGPAGH